MRAASIINVGVEMDENIGRYMAALARRKSAKMTKRQRSDHARKMALARWAKRKPKGDRS
jgi:hypothetical protein